MRKFKNANEAPSVSLGKLRKKIRPMQVGGEFLQHFFIVLLADITMEVMKRML